MMISSLNRQQFIDICLAALAVIDPRQSRAELLHLPLVHVEAPFSEVCATVAALLVRAGSSRDPEWVTRRHCVSSLATELFPDAVQPRAIVPAAVEGVAIVGIGCRLPGAERGPAGLWHALLQGVDGRSDIRSRSPPEIGKLFESSARWCGVPHILYGGFLAAIDSFDAEAFGLTEADAAALDPQQRLALEVAWEALADASVDRQQLKGARVGVYMGAAPSAYAAFSMRSDRMVEAGSVGATANAMIANRISYFLGAIGPSMVVDAACSSSLIAVDLARRALLSHQVDAALAGGVNLILTPQLAISTALSGLLSVEGRCRFLDAESDGYLRGEGGGVVVLKRLGDAVTDGDRIYAVIRGGAVAHSGRTNGPHSPSAKSQEQVIQLACSDGTLDSADISYVEAHGTGTPVGDRIEAVALSRAIALNTLRQTPLLIGSIKGNVGHGEAVAGVASLMKAALVIYHRQIPPTLHHQSPPPSIDLDALGLEIVTAEQPWSGGLVGVSAFGFGGANAHVVLGAAPTTATITTAVTPTAWRHSAHWRR